MRTLHDCINAGEDAPYRTRITEPPHAAMPHFRCRCGRLVPADMMLDLAPEGSGGVPEKLRGQDRYRCDACWRRWIGRGEIDPDELRRLTGQPPRSDGSKPW